MLRSSPGRRGLSGKSGYYIVASWAKRVAWGRTSAAGEGSAPAQQGHRVRGDALAAPHEAHSLSGGGLDVDLARRDSERFRQASAHHLGLRGDPRAAGGEGDVAVPHPPAPRRGEGG